MPTSATFWKPRSKVWYQHNSDKKLGKVKIQSSGREVEAYQDDEGNRYTYVEKLEGKKTKKERFYF